jgi:hypothetical protein
MVTHEANETVDIYLLAFLITILASAQICRTRRPRAAILAGKYWQLQADQINHDLRRF